MAIYLRIEGGVAVSAFEPPEGVPLSDSVHPSVLDDFRPKGGAEVGWVLKDGILAPPQPLARPSVSDLLAYAADKRWRVETGGITVGGVSVATDDRSKTMIMGARIKADADPDYAVGWKGVDGSFVTLGAEQIIAISDAVLAHVDACFAAEAALVTAIEASEVSSMTDIDAWPWP